MTRYFFKELISNPVWLPSGARFPFHNVGDDTGIWETDDPMLVLEAEHAIQRGVGGLSEITKEKYDELIKKKQDSPPPSSSLQDSMHRRVALDNPNLSPFSAPFEKAEEVVAVADNAQTPEPVTVPKKADFKKPTVSKAKLEVPVTVKDKPK